MKYFIVVIAYLAALGSCSNSNGKVHKSVLAGNQEWKIYIQPGSEGNQSDLIGYTHALQITSENNKGWRIPGVHDWAKLAYYICGDSSKIVNLQEFGCNQLFIEKFGITSFPSKLNNGKLLVYDKEIGSSIMFWIEGLETFYAGRDTTFPKSIGAYAIEFFNAKSIKKSDRVMASDTLGAQLSLMLVRDL